MAFEEGLPIDIFWLVFEQLIGDTNTLATIGLVSRKWRNVSLPTLLSRVDLSSHNNGRLPEYEDEDFPPVSLVMADYSDRYRPGNLVTRQRAFLRLMTDRPELAIYVKALAWTLIWIDFGEQELSKIDLRTWDVFALLRNVRYLDLASLHEIGGYEPFIRQNPSRLFPAVTRLRLVGWMHRGLVKAIVSSLNASKLASLELHYLEDEGALPDGQPIPSGLARQYAHRSGNPYDSIGIDDELWARQERGQAAIFPGPMWFPLRLLRQQCLSSMTHFQIRLIPATHTLDQRNYNTMFNETVQFIQSTKDTLKSLSIGLGENPIYHCGDEVLRTVCGTGRMRLKFTYRPMCFDLTSAFLHRLLAVLTEEQFPHLTRVELVGFRILRTGSSSRANPELTWQYIRNCPFVDEEFLEIANISCRYPFCGHDYDLPKMGQNKFDALKEILRAS
ncbi:hypothetical protein F5B22DRAFT_601353 [Xylaria bambusicola]|uniref:uncharacterized protein n=1 Tax=Xylaria bambusicola TaxID=326684 RepID=UPI002007FE41|nr:uncharacterized protein F5B22DRAFT_601353 [Xylaria bambusicola]KAI0517997.1 hypothetical protein F5B22DRAFT_601353 [Xylaria bambusicola]